MQGNPMLKQNRFPDQFIIEIGRNFRVPFLLAAVFHEYRQLDSIPACPNMHNKEWKVHGIRIMMGAYLYMDGNQLYFKYLKGPKNVQTGL